MKEKSPRSEGLALYMKLAEKKISSKKKSGGSKSPMKGKNDGKC